jgi:hypothetical protein
MKMHTDPVGAAIAELEAEIETRQRVRIAIRCLITICLMAFAAWRWL